METGFRVNTTFHPFLKFFFVFFHHVVFKNFFLFFLSAAQTSPREKERTQVTETKEKAERGAHTQRGHPSERLRSKNVKGKKSTTPFPKDYES